MLNLVASNRFDRNTGDILFCDGESNYFRFKSMKISLRFGKIAGYCVFVSSLGAILMNSPVALAQTSQKTGDWASLQLKYDAPTPVANFGAALPIGNGRLGAKIFGNVASEIINLNESTLWSGIPRAYDDPKSAQVLPQVRAALAAGEYKKADELARGMQGKNNQAYQPLGNLALDFAGTEGFTNYSRELDLDRAVMTLRYRIGDVNYTREIFASFPDQVIVMRVSGDKPGHLGFKAALDTQLQGKYRLEGQTVVMNGRAPYFVDTYARPPQVLWDENKGIGFESRLNIKNSGGTVSADGNALRVANADSAVLIFSSANSFNGADKDPATQGKNFSLLARNALSAASGRSYESLLSRHISDHQSLFRRLWVEINGEKPNRHALAYQWARYNLIACSRPGGGAPRNEQGIWNRDLFPRYASNFTLNENPNKYYAVAEPGNLGEVTQPLLQYVGALAKNGAVTARVNYGFKGWVAHHNSDVWAMTTMATGDPCWANWPMGGIWLCENVWDRYKFSGDKKYLRQEAYPLFKGAAEFALELMVLNKEGFLVTSPSTSPENHFFDAQGQRVAVSQGTTLDMALLRQLFGHCIEATSVLGIDAAFKAKLQATLPKMLPFRIGSQGQLNEWEFDYSDTLKEWQPNHRHVSHVISAWPLSQINRQTPELLAAARKSLELRGSGGYHPDKAGMWARLLDGDKALAALVLSYPTNYDSPFGGFAEMLLQSQAGSLDILPALPAAWQGGKISGLRGRGNYEIDIEWAGGQLTRAAIRSYASGTPLVTVRGQAVNLKTDRRIDFKLVK